VRLTSRPGDLNKDRRGRGGQYVRAAPRCSHSWRYRPRARSHQNDLTIVQTGSDREGCPILPRLVRR
jgi:hypothetical protein